VLAFATNFLAEIRTQISEDTLLAAVDILGDSAGEQYSVDGRQSTQGLRHKKILPWRPTAGQAVKKRLRHTRRHAEAELGVKLVANL
jgi:hypothetical protein